MVAAISTIMRATRKASNPLTPRPQATTQRTIATAVERTISMRRRSLAGGGAGHPGDGTAHGDRGILPRGDRLGGGAHQARADDDAVGPGVRGGRRVVRRGDAEAERD